MDHKDLKLVKFIISKNIDVTQEHLLFSLTDFKKYKHIQ